MEAELDPKSLWSISYGIYVVTSAHDGRSNGQIANAVIQVAAEPPRVLAAINKNNYTHELIEKSGVFAVSVLGEDVPMPFIGGFGFKSGRDTDKMTSVEMEEGSTGIPCVTEHAIAMFEVRVFATADAGTHTVFIGDVVSGRVLKEGVKPLTYAQYQANKGKAPKNAPTYRAPEKKGESGMKRYVCNVCGYIYDPEEGDPDGNIPAGTAFEDLPDDWVCPVCGAEKSEFSPED